MPLHACFRNSDFLIRLKSTSLMSSLLMTTQLSCSCWTATGLVITGFEFNNLATYSQYSFSACFNVQPACLQFLHQPQLAIISFLSQVCFQDAFLSSCLMLQFSIASVATLSKSANPSRLASSGNNSDRLQLVVLIRVWALSLAALQICRMRKLCCWITFRRALFSISYLEGRMVLVRGLVSLVRSQVSMDLLSKQNPSQVSTGSFMIYCEMGHRNQLGAESSSMGSSIIQSDYMRRAEQRKRTTKKEKIFESLFSMAYEPVVVGKKNQVGATNYYSTVFNALNNVSEHMMIKLNPGVYNQRIEIRKKDLKIQATEISENSILISQEHPTVTVNLDSPDDKIYLESIKIVHTCENTQRHDTANPSYGNIKKQDYMSFKASPAMNACLYIVRGTVQLDECKLSLAMFHSKDATCPCIVVEKDGCLIMNRCEVRGAAGTVGIFSRGGSVVIKESIIKHHGVAGLLFSSKNPQSHLTLKNCSFQDNTQSVVINGPFEAVVENNSIRDCTQAGIVICNGSQSWICNNDIKHCRYGIEVKNSFPSVLKNTIAHSKGWGLVIRSSGGFLCRPTLKFNTINENEEGAILVQGSLNNSIICNNQLNYNNACGVKVSNRASPHIFGNKIMKTLGNGVHVQESCSVFLEKNQIEDSLKCNLVLQGPNNINNFIYRNVISKARGEGIFSVFGEKFTIKENQITENYNGVVSLTGVENIEENIISRNSRNGILLICDNNLNITQNQIEQNKQAGIFIRDSSVAQIVSNYFANNKTELVIEKDDPLFSDIEAQNQFEGEPDIRIPKNYRCSIM